MIFFNFLYSALGSIFATEFFFCFYLSFSSCVFILLVLDRISVNKNTIRWMEREKLKRCTKNYNSQNKLASSGYLCILCGSFRFSFALSLFKQKMDIFVKYVHFTLGIHILLEKNHWVHKFSSGFYHKTLPNCMYLQSLSTVHDWTAYWFINMYCFSRKTDL